MTSGEEAADGTPEQPRRFCMYTLIRPGMRERYFELHRAVWPGVLEQIHRSHFRNYTIFLRGDMLVQYFEYDGDDFDHDQAASQAHEESQRWWRETEPCQLDPEPGTPGGPWRVLEQVWRLEDASPRP